MPRWYLMSTVSTDTVLTPMRRGVKVGGATAADVCGGPRARAASAPRGCAAPGMDARRGAMTGTHVPPQGIGAWRCTARDARGGKGTSGTRRQWALVRPARHALTLRGIMRGCRAGTLSSPTPPTHTTPTPSTSSQAPALGHADRGQQQGQGDRPPSTSSTATYTPGGAAHVLRGAAHMQTGHGLYTAHTNGPRCTQNPRRVTRTHSL